MINSIRLGYPGENLTLERVRLNRTVMLNDRHPSEIRERCIRLAQKNLRDLMKILEWNEAQGIRFFRISSSIFPHISNWRCFSHTDKLLDHRGLFYELELFETQLQNIGKFAREHGHRLTFHPPPYTILNTEKHFVLITVIRELYWHTKFLDLADLRDGTITIHIGGIYGDKKASMDRFVQRFKELPREIQNRIIIENDEFDYSINDVIEISHRTGAPICFDYFHYCCYNSFSRSSDKDRQFSLKKVFREVIASWAQKKIKPKMHLSEQALGARAGTHSLFIEKIPKELLTLDIDLMLESKCKEKTVLKLLRKYGQKK